MVGHGRAARTVHHGQPAHRLSWPPGPASVAALGGAEVYKALGAGDNITYWSDVQDGTHCANRPEWRTPLQQNIQKFLLKTGNAAGVIRISSRAPGNLADWRDWTTPTLTDGPTTPPDHPATDHPAADHPAADHPARPPRRPPRRRPPAADRWRLCGDGVGQPVDGGFVATVRVTAGAAPVNGWTVTMTLPSGASDHQRLERQPERQHRHRPVHQRRLQRLDRGRPVDRVRLPGHRHRHRHGDDPHLLGRVTARPGAEVHEPPRRAVRLRGRSPVVEPDHDAGQVVEHGRDARPDGRGAAVGGERLGSYVEDMPSPSPRNDAPAQSTAVTLSVGSASSAPTTRNCWSRWFGVTSGQRVDRGRCRR